MKDLKQLTPEDVEALDPQEREVLRDGPFTPGERVKMEHPQGDPDVPFLGKSGTFVGYKGPGADQAKVRFDQDLTFLVSAAGLRRLLPGEDVPPEGPPPGRPERLPWG